MQSELYCSHACAAPGHKQSMKPSQSRRARPDTRLMMFMKSASQAATQSKTMLQLLLRCHGRTFATSGSGDCLRRWPFKLLCASARLAIAAGLAICEALATRHRLGAPQHHRAVEHLESCVLRGNTTAMGTDFSRPSCLYAFVQEPACL